MIWELMSYIVKHFMTITKHKWWVFRFCIKAGIPWQGIMHDLSKYSPTEFIVGARYYQGVRSPNAAEREDIGYSTAWIHHKGRNRHHFEYWTDLNRQTGRYESVPMPRKYLAEMIMDRRAACMTYQGNAYTDASPYNYFASSHDRTLMHPKLDRELEYLLMMLRDEGERKTFRYIKEQVIPRNTFPWEK